MRHAIAILALGLTGCRDRQQAPPPTPASAATPAPPPAPAAPTPPAPAAREVPLAPGQPVVEIRVTEKGYEPATVTVAKGRPTHFKVKRVYEQTCATGIVIPAAGVSKDLPVGQTVEFALAADADTPFGCPMGMMIAGTIAVK